MTAVLGIDIGGTGIKGAPVDVEEGKLLAERQRVLTPHPATPEAMADCIAEIATHFNWQERIGCGYPGVVKKGVTMTAANLDEAWIGTDAKSLIEQKTNCKTTLINDADAAGLAEVHFGAARDRTDVVLMVTLGTGIGTALFVNKVLVPNTELGHVELNGKDAERRASERVGLEKALSGEACAKRVDTHLTYLQRLQGPGLII